MVSLEFLIDIILLAAQWPLGSTQPQTEMSIRNIPGGLRQPVRRADSLTTSCASSLEIWESQPAGTLWACTGMYRDWVTF